MDEGQLKDLLSKRLYLELQIFKDSMLRHEKADIFGASYEIEIYVNLYGIFMVHADNLKKDTIRGLLNLRSGILESVYQEWLKREDRFFDELKVFACKELEDIPETGNKECGKERKDGKEPDQTAQGR